MVSTANVALQDQIYGKDPRCCVKSFPTCALPPPLAADATSVRNLTALASTEPSQQDLLAFLDDDLTPNNQAEQKLCATLKQIRQLPLGRPARS